MDICEKVKKNIIDAFSGKEIPKGKLCSAEYDYEDAHGGFTGTTWEQHDALFLRTHDSSLCFFTKEAFRYYLPAYMMAELENPEVADCISESIAFHFTESPLLKERIVIFNKNELLAIISFFNCCANRYSDGIYDVFFNEAAAEVQKAIKLVAK